MTILDRLTELADPTRSRLLLVLERHELSVSELCSVLQLPQSTVSRHLKVLGDEGWVASRANGTSRHYRMTRQLDAPERRLWQIVRDQIAAEAGAQQDAERVRRVVAERGARSQEFFSTAAAQWDALRTELFGVRADFVPVLGLLDESWVVGDLGCGTGRLTTVLAPFVARVIGVDSSRAMLAAARRRVADADNVELRHGDLETLPIADGELDVAILSLVLHHVAEPERALVEVRRVLGPEGRLLVVDMMPHDREEYRERMGHVWQGFGAEQLDEWLDAAGFSRCRYRPLPADPEAKGPVLFAATAKLKAAQSIDTHSGVAA